MDEPTMIIIDIPPEMGMYYKSITPDIENQLEQVVDVLQNKTLFSKLFRILKAFSPFST